MVKSIISTPETTFPIPVPETPTPVKIAQPYKRPNYGHPVQPGQDWRHLSMAQRKAWMAAHESRWKQRYNAGSGDTQAQMGWTRG